MVEVCVMVLSVARLVFHDGLNSVVLERKDAGHRGSGVARKQVNATKFWGGRNIQHGTPCGFVNLGSAQRPPKSELNGHREHQRRRNPRIRALTGAQGSVEDPYATRPSGALGRGEAGEIINLARETDSSQPFYPPGDQGRTAFYRRLSRR